MPRSRAVGPVSDQRRPSEQPARRIYIFRCDGSGLYAFTADREGRMLPLQMYPQISWHLEYVLTVRFDGDSSRDKILRVALDGIAKHGFHLIHGALYGELLGFMTPHIEAVQS
jgi:hypothetical protein